MSKPKERYAVIGLIANITESGRKPTILKIEDAEKFIKMKNCCEKIKTLIEKQKHIDEEIYKTRIESLKRDIYNQSYAISYNYGFVLEIKFDYHSGDTIIFLKQDGYTFNISEVLSI